MLQTFDTERMQNYLRNWSCMQLFPWCIGVENLSCWNSRDRFYGFCGDLWPVAILASLDPKGATKTAETSLQVVALAGSIMLPAWQKRWTRWQSKSLQLNAPLSVPGWSGVCLGQSLRAKCWEEHSMNMYKECQDLLEHFSLGPNSGTAAAAN